MAIMFPCSGCNSTIQVREEFAGQQVRCPRCQTVLTAPASAKSLDVPPATGGSVGSSAQWIRAENPACMPLTQTTNPAPSATGTFPHQPKHRSDPEFRERRRRSDEEDFEPVKSGSRGVLIAVCAGFAIGIVLLVASLVAILPSRTTTTVANSNNPPNPGGNVPNPFNPNQNPPNPNPVGPGENLPKPAPGGKLPPIEDLQNGQFLQPPRSKVPTSYLKAVSSPGDYIGQGKTYDYQGNQLQIKKTARGVSINVDGWHIDFGGPQGKFLHVGEFKNAKRHAFSDGFPGIDFSGNGRGCNKIAGDFYVWELEFAGNQVTSLAIDFVQRCEENGPPLYGRIRFNSSFE